jgi:hypothetical protein
VRNAPSPRNRTMIDDRQGTPMTAAARPDRLRRRRTLLPYAAALAALLTVPACTGADPGPTATTPPVSTTSTSTTASEPPSTTTSPTTSVDPVLAKIPAPARAQSEKGAQAFARFFIEQLNVGAMRPDGNVLNGLFIASCKTCVAMHASLEDLEKRDQRHDGQSIKVLATSSIKSSASRPQVLVDVQQISVKVLDSKGRTVRTTASGPGSFVMTLSLVNGHWVAQRLQSVS